MVEMTKILLTLHLIEKEKPLKRIKTEKKTFSERYSEFHLKTNESEDPLRMWSSHCFVLAHTCISLGMKAGEELCGLENVQRMCMW